LPTFAQNFTPWTLSKQASFVFINKKV
jgi:hypothetical protein